VQVDPIKPTLNTPGTKQLKLEHDEPLSNFEFKLRRYIEEAAEPTAKIQPSEAAMPITAHECVASGWQLTKVWRERSKRGLAAEQYSLVGR
jgi:hypothetical protein